MIAIPLALSANGTISTAYATRRPDQAMEYARPYKTSMPMTAFPAAGFCVMSYRAAQIVRPDYIRNVKKSGRYVDKHHAKSRDEEHFATADFVDQERAS